MDRLAPSPIRWTLHHPSWLAATERLQSGLTAGQLEMTVLSPLLEHFEFAWRELALLAAVATRFAPPPGARPLPIQHLAEFVLDDLFDVFRGAAAEVVLLVPDGERWTGDPSPEDVLEEATRFERYLVVARLSATERGDPLAAAIAHVADVLADWTEQLRPIVHPIREILERVNYGAADGFSERRRGDQPN
jgi:hypothetical protein